MVSAHKNYYRDISIPDAIKALAAAIKEDPDYRLVWEANIAVKFTDEYYRFNMFEDTSDTKIHAMARRAAANFVDLLIKESERGE
jgi:hypothetical protein